ncbi:SDR family oxidoreductase [Flavobacterium beibuense]|uniref:Putative nucleoside-diphosphate sugar epimerase n=1 Tax=Flavobacterium beibuense TaxID=657326 RepID=A0A444WF14_9FLAO|nr:NmrA family NAD(P)-binding protein [Flavobacterium beibuense]RYJ44443.1 putative nucleoside-diphosphate sugar epimerase [Flavobacterium beibuense]
MKITVTGSLGNVAKPLAESLIAKGNDITIVSSSTDRKQDIEKLGAKAAIGSVNDTAFLTNAFTGADAVFAMTPPNLGGTNVVANTTEAGKNLAQAIKDSGVKRVVMLSSIGADKPNGNGPIAAIHNIENMYNEIDDVNFTFVRAGFFYYNFFNDIPLIKNAGITGANYAADIKMAMVHPRDIAAVIAEELENKNSTNKIRYAISDIRTPQEVAAVLGSAIGKPELPWVQFTDEQLIEGMTQAGLPLDIAEMYTDMGRGLGNGRIQEHFNTTDGKAKGKIKLEEFAKEFALKF